MRAIRPYRGGEPGADQVRVRVEACVAGGAELRAMERGDVTPGGAAVGVVDATGENATELAGARVVVGAFDPCGECAVCRRADVAVCPHRVARGDAVDGALSTHVLAAARWVCRLDGDLAHEALAGPAAALLGREAAVAYTMFARLGVASGDPVAVIGDGAIGALVRQIAAARGARLVDDGADAGAPVRLFETTGGVGGRERAVSRLGPGARVALIAPRVTGAAAIDALPVRPIAESGATLIAVAGAHPDLVPELAALAVKGDIDLAAVAAPISPGDLSDLESHVLRGERDGAVPVVTAE